MNLASLKVGPRIYACVGAVIALLLICSAVGVYNLQRVNHDVTMLTGDRIPKLNKAAEWKVSLLQSARQSRDLLVVEDGDPIYATLAAEAAHRDELQKWFQQNVISEAGVAALHDVLDLHARYSQSEAAFLSLVKAGKLADARARLTDETRPLQEKYLQAMEVFTASQQNLVTDQGKDAQAQFVAGLTLMFAISGVGLALAILIGLVLTRSITRPIALAVSAAERIADGDLTVATEIQGKDELAQLLHAIAAMTANLRKIVLDVRMGVESVGTASAQIAAGNQDLSARTEQQASSLEQTAASMEQLTANVRQSADNAREADQLANSTSAAATNGGEVMGRVVSTMQDISASSKKMSDIIGVIDGIAFQTNILALNAAVEAARAGEQGRGFAVVASEVRSLAQRSAQAAREIKTMIDASVQKVDAGGKMVLAAGESINDIVSQVQRITALIGEISSAAREQSAGIGQINDAVSHMDQSTQQNAALVEQSAAAATSLRDQAGKLAESIALFKLATH